MRKEKFLLEEKPMMYFKLKSEFLPYPFKLPPPTFIKIV